MRRWMSRPDNAASTTPGPFPTLSGVFSVHIQSLTNWTEQHFRSLFQAVSSNDFDAAFDETFTKDVHITVNGAHVSRDQYKKQLQGEEFDEAAATVDFSGAVEVPDEKLGAKAGSVGVFLTATIVKKIIILGAPAESTVTSSINVVVIQDPAIKQPTLPHGIHGFFDPRRVSVLNQVIVDRAVQPVLPGSTADSA